ncbi:hypothetical protein J3E68DRAFT_424573 [Trichoderma sp. SZMC 28012]
MDSRYPRQIQLAAPPSSNFKRAGSGSRWTSKPHKARDITEVSNRNTISKDSTQRNELCALKLRNRDTISKDLTQSDRPKDLTQSDRPFKYGRQMRNGSLAIPPSASPGLYAVHQPSAAQQQQHLQQQSNMKNPSAKRHILREQPIIDERYWRLAMLAQQFQDTGATKVKNPIFRLLSPEQLHQFRHRIAAESNPEVVYDPQAIRAQQRLFYLHPSSSNNNRQP